MKETWVYCNNDRYPNNFESAIAGMMLGFYTVIWFTLCFGISSFYINL